MLRLAGEDTRDMPRFPEEVHRLDRDAKRLGGAKVPLPVPGGAGTVEQPLRYGERREAA